MQRYLSRSAEFAKTYELYSTFTTNYKPAGEYENLLVAASKLRGPAVKAYQRVEAFEQSLVRTLLIISILSFLIFMCTSDRFKRSSLWRRILIT